MPMVCQVSFVMQDIDLLSGHVTPASCEWSQFVGNIVDRQEVSESSSPSQPVSPKAVLVVIPPLPKAAPSSA